MLKRTPLYELHCQAGAKLVDFSGWEMPLHYGSQIKEHHHVRQDVGMFDVSHMGVLDINGLQATQFLCYILANDIKKLQAQNKALYTCMLNQRGGVIDDLIVYRLGDNDYRIILNAGSREKDYQWLQQQARNFTIHLEQRPDLCILAVQGPKAISVVKKILSKDAALQLDKLKPFFLMQLDNGVIARTGYTGEDGVEMILPHAQAKELWQQLLNHDVSPCGLGARDTLRLEAGLNLYGHDMDESVTPLESNLAWTIVWNDARDFIGKAALLKQKQQGVKYNLVGLVMQEPGVLRDQQKVYLDDDAIGIITSGGFSPTLGYAIALVRVPIIVHSTAFVERHGKRVPVQLVKPPFVRHGKRVYGVNDE